MLLVLLLWLPFYACDDSESTSFDPNLPVTVDGIMPDSGTVAIPIVISGNNFGTDKSNVKVYFDDREAVVITAKNEHLYVLNPRQTDGYHTIKVVVDKQEGILNNKQFRYIVSSSVTTVAGTGEWDYLDGNAMEAMFGGPRYLEVDDQDNVLVADYNEWVRLVSTSENKVTTLLESSGSIYQLSFTPDYSHLYVAAESKPQLLHDFYRPGNWAHGFIIDDGTIDDYIASIAVDEENNIFMIGYYGTFSKVNTVTNDITYFGELPELMNAAGKECFMTYNPHDKYLYITSPGAHAIFRVDSKKESFEESDFKVYTGNPNASGFNNGTIEMATFNNPRGTAFDSEGNMFVADYNNNAIRKITPDGQVTTYCGGTAGHKDGIIEEAMFDGPSDIAINKDGFLYVADYRNYRIRLVAVQ